MDNNIQSLIKERYKQLPKNIQEAINTNDLAGKFSLIANKHGLHIDQNGALQTETLLVMLGLEPTDDYVNNVQKELEVSRSEAESIAEDVNKEILDAIRTSLREIQETEDQAEENNSIADKPTSPIPPQTQQKPLTTLEQVGNFTIEPPRKPSNSPQYNDSSLNKARVLDHMENPPKIPETPSSPASMVDHLLANPVSSLNKAVEKKGEQMQQKPRPAPAARTAPRSSMDPYREPIE